MIPSTKELLSIDKIWVKGHVIFKPFCERPPEDVDVYITIDRQGTILNIDYAVSKTHEYVCSNELVDVGNGIRMMERVWLKKPRYTNVIMMQDYDISHIEFDYKKGENNNG